jgi:probable HAF family extracellular repeat protein
MTDPNLFTISRPLAALLGLALCGISANAADYSLTEISPLADQTKTFPAAINNSGEAAGTSGDVAFHYANGMKENLGSLLGGKMSDAYSINNLGDVVGESTFNDSGIKHATFFAKGEAVDLGTPSTSGPGDYSVARGINDYREVVGYSGPDATSDSTQAFIFDEKGGMQGLGTLGGDYSQASAICNAHFITGNSQLAARTEVRHAFLLQPKSEMRDLGTLNGNSISDILDRQSSYGTSVNDLGHVVGYSTLDASARVHAFFCDGKGMRDLGSLGPKAIESDSSAALGINAKDEVVGTTYANYTGGKLVQIAFIYRNGVMEDLNGLVDLSNLPYQLESATAINDAGQIVVQALNRNTNTLRAVLLTPYATHQKSIHQKSR